jgi:hypothetical protein
MECCGRRVCCCSYFEDDFLQGYDPVSSDINPPTFQGNIKSLKFTRLHDITVLKMVIFVVNVIKRFIVPALPPRHHIHYVTVFVHPCSGRESQ